MGSSLSKDSNVAPQLVANNAIKLLPIFCAAAALIASIIPQIFADKQTNVEKESDQDQVEETNAKEGVDARGIEEVAAVEGNTEASSVNTLESITPIRPYETVGKRSHGRCTNLILDLYVPVPLDGDANGKEDSNVKARCTEEIAVVEAKTNTEASSQDSIDSIRPYGLPVEMEGKRSHVWELIFEKVNDFESIINLREACVMFMELLARKYIETMIPQAIGTFFVNGSARWQGGRRGWLKALADLRTLSKVSKKSVDSIINGGLIGKAGTHWFSTQEPHFLMNEATLILRLGATQEEQRQLQETLDELSREKNPVDCFPLRSLIFDETHDYGVTVNLSNLRSRFETVIMKIGKKITSFLYRTKDSSFEAYVNLSRWLVFMPNVRDLIVDLRGPILLKHWEKSGKITVESFPTCRRLKRYGEGLKGFGVPFLVEILRANPTIQEVLIGDTSYNGWDKVTSALKTLKITKFHSTGIPSDPFYDCHFNWADQLTTLALWDPSDRYAQDIPSKKLCNFISRFPNLVELMVASPYIMDNGGSLKLPKLQYLAWKLFPTCKTLQFLQPVKSLRFLDLDVSQCADTRRLEKTRQFLNKWIVPTSFPKMKMIRIMTQQDGQFTKFSPRA